MLVTAAKFSDYLLAVHILAVVVTFGVTFAYPIFSVVGQQLDRRAMPWFHRTQQAISRRLTNPGLLVVLVAGVVLASNKHQWKHFYVQWGIGAVIVLGALEGGFMVRSAGKVTELAQRDITAAGQGEVTWSQEYEALSRRVGGVGTLRGLIVVVTVFFMALHLGQ